MAHAVAQPLLLGFLSTISARQDRDRAVGMMVRKETTPAHCVRDSSQALLVPFFSREVLALSNSSTALLGLAWRASLGSSHSSRATCPHQGSTSHQVQVNGLLLQNEFLNFTASRLQHLTYTENSSTLTSAEPVPGYPQGQGMPDTLLRGRQWQPVGCKHHLLRWTPRMTTLV